MDIEHLGHLLPASMTRRRLLRLGLAAVPVGLVAAACSSNGGGSAGGTGAGEGGTLSAPPSCDDGDMTPSQTEGPFFSTGSPERTSIVDGADGTALVVAGAVLTTDCRVASGAKLDFWQADDDGDYDNEGYGLRGHQFADERGRYRLETIVPANYGARTRHIHVKVQADGGPVLTTQLYFPGEAANDRDGLFDPALLLDVSDAADGRAAAFDFVVES